MKFGDTERTRVGSFPVMTVLAESLRRRPFLRGRFVCIPYGWFLCRFSTQTGCADGAYVKSRIPPVSPLPFPLWFMPSLVLGLHGICEGVDQLTRGQHSHDGKCQWTGSRKRLPITAPLAHDAPKALAISPFDRASRKLAGICFAMRARRRHRPFGRMVVIRADRAGRPAPDGCQGALPGARLSAGSRP